MTEQAFRTVSIPVALDTDELVRQLAAIRLFVSQIGFALDSLILALTDEEAP